MPQARREPDVSCACTFERVEARREARRNKPQPWLLRKFMVVVVLGIVGFSAYVYIGRLVVPALRGDDHSALDRPAGIGLVVGYSIVLLMLLWSYAMVVIVSPGFAIDHVEKTEAPVAPPAPVPWHTDSYTESNVSPPSSLRPPRAPTTSYDQERKVLHPELQRQPRAHPILRAEYRYCYREGILKPKRTHHCRACGKCVLAYDHHCPWIGQCVGARNVRFFFVFNEWVLLYTIYVFVSLVVASRRLSARFGDVDGFFIVCMALSALFFVFSVGMVGTHLRLNMINQTTVESMDAHRMREHENAVLSNALPWWDARSRRLIRQRWDDEWGNPNTEGNIWWLGSSSANWRARMGDSVVGWFVPIISKPVDGMDYAVNPRFDADGRWRRREEWPLHLR